MMGMSSRAPSDRRKQKSQPRSPELCHRTMPDTLLAVTLCFLMLLPGATCATADLIIFQVPASALPEFMATCACFSAGVSLLLFKWSRADDAKVGRPATCSERIAPCTIQPHCMRPARAQPFFLTGSHAPPFHLVACLAGYLLHPRMGIHLQRRQESRELRAALLQGHRPP